MREKIILLVDDEADMLENCSRLLRSMGYTPVTASDGEKALRVIEKESPDLVLSDLKMPGMGGIEFLHRVKAGYPGLEVIIFTAFGSIESAVEAVKEGAFDYLPKPFTADQLKHSIDRAIQTLELTRENRNLKRQLSDNFKFGNIIGKSRGIRRVLETVQKISLTNASILILGESGTGKELIANAIHANSRRVGRPFVPLDCAALPETLIESELFGHEKGAFTGAHASREGLFETANTGTLFLDEIGELSMGLQAKLLRVLQERKIRKVGGRKQINLDIRIISATNRDLKKAIEEGKFREELYFRLNVVSISLPPLRERPEDIPLLCDFFLKKYAASNAAPLKTLSKEAMARLKASAWPGNIRELQNSLERAASISEGDRIEAQDFLNLTTLVGKKFKDARKQWAEDFLNCALADKKFKDVKKKWVEDFERRYMEELLSRTGGNITRASEVSGLPRMSIYRILKKIDSPAANPAGTEKK